VCSSDPVRDALTKYFDIQGHVKYSLASQFLPYIKNSEQKAWLENLLIKEHRGEFKKYFDENALSVSDLLTGELSSCAIPLTDFLHIVPVIQPRYYTISSSSSCFPTSVHITVSVTEYLLASGKKFRGLCTGYLQNLQSNIDTCRIFVKESSFRLPKQLSTPIIMIGPGTGIAPMRALLQERKWQQQQQPNSKEPSRNVLYFGCKNRDVDFIYRDEFEAHVQDGTLTEMHLAFSRDQAEKVYVQHLMVAPANADAIMADINNGAYIFVCGATSMGTDVNEALVSVVQSKKNVSRVEAAAFVKKLQASGRYVQELWST